MTPIEFLLSVMRNPRAPVSRRMDAAKAAAPYCHPRLNAISVNLKDLSDEALEDLARD